MLAQTTLLVILLCLNPINASASEGPVPVLELPRPTPSRVLTVPSNPPMTDLTNVLEEVATYDVPGLTPPKGKKSEDNNEKLFGLQHVPSDQEEEYEELPSSCCGCLCPRRRVPKFRNPRFSTTSKHEGRISRTASWISRQPSTSTTSEYGRTVSASLSRSTTLQENTRVWSFLKRYRSSKVDSPKAGAPPTSRPQSALEPRIQRNMTQPEPDGNYHELRLDASTTTGSEQQGMPGSSLEVSTSARGTLPEHSERGDV